MEPDRPYPILAPSILAADHGNLLSGLSAVLDQPCPWLHLDIMDGHFVPNLSFGPATVQSLRRAAPDLFFDTHLMLQNPHQFVDAFADAGSDLICFHIEPSVPVRDTLRHIQARGLQCGLALNPATPAEAIRPFLKDIDLVLVMTVWPGFGGQSFIDDCLPKISQLRRWREEDGSPFRIEVDGGINPQTLQQCKVAGADTFVAGTAFFKDAASLLGSMES